MLKVISYIIGMPDDNEEVGQVEDIHQATQMVNDFIASDYEDCDVVKESEMKWVISSDFLDFDVVIEIT